MVSEVSDCVTNATTVQQVNDPRCRPGDPAPAKAAGIQPGDEIVAVGSTPIREWSDLLRTVQGAEGPTPMTVLRDGERVQLTVDVPQVTRPAENGGTEQAGAIGVAPSSLVPHGPVAALGGTAAFTGELVAETWQRLLEFPERIPAVVEAIFGGERDPNTPISVVGASRIGGEAVEQGLWEVFLFLLASLNFFVGIFNLLPLLPLDGGHIAVTWYERVRDWLRKLRGKVPAGPVDYTRLNAVTMVLVVIGGAVVLLTVTADIVNPIRLMR